METSKVCLKATKSFAINTQYRHELSGARSIPFHLSRRLLKFILFTLAAICTKRRRAYTRAPIADARENRWQSSDACDKNAVEVFAIIQYSPQGRSFPGDGENGYRHDEQATGDAGQIDRQRKLYLHPQQRESSERDGPRAEWWATSFFVKRTVIRSPRGNSRILGGALTVTSRGCPNIRAWNFRMKLPAAFIYHEHYLASRLRARAISR